ncbi:MAG: UDP-glucose 4-epimerase [Vicingaceae bacterium]|jgi:UDP-glucose 4-epimerase
MKSTFEPNFRQMNILITGGAGYIGSHTIIQLLEQGFKNIYSIDNYVNSTEKSYQKIEKITGKKVTFFDIDLTDKLKTQTFFENNQIRVVIHFAALKSVPDSVESPLEYYSNNINGLLNVLVGAKLNGVKKIIFSSSCSIYGNPEKLPVSEETPFGEAESPYASTKQIGETILKDFATNNLGIDVVSLRYFNPVGAHSSGLIGEPFTKRPNNLVPIITQTAANLREEITVFGSDYNTTDGTCIRDYIHVDDIANAHIKAINFQNTNKSNYSVFNLGTGKGTSVLEIIKSFEQVNKLKVNYKLGPRRAGDVETIYADNTKAKKELNWVAKLTINDMVSSAWKWQQNMKV